MKEFVESPDLLETIASESRTNDEEAKRLAGNLNEQQLNWKRQSISGASLRYFHDKRLPR